MQGSFTYKDRQKLRIIYYMYNNSAFIYERLFTKRFQFWFDSNINKTWYKRIKINCHPSNYDKFNFKS